MNCKGCSKALPQDARFCPNCGTPAGAKRGVEYTLDDFRAVERTGERPTDAKCPRCQIGMTESLYGETSVDECFGCGGAWFDAEEMKAFVAKYRARKEAVEGPPLEGKLRRFAADASVVYLPCPRCEKLMSRHNFGKISGVIVDRCAHGVWLDGGELEKIVAFIQTGGLVASENRRLEEIKDQARSYESRADLARRTLSRYGAGSWIGPVTFWDVW